MSKKRKRRRTYRQQLVDKKREIQLEINSLDKRLSGNECDKLWFEDYRKRNELKIDLLTVKSRLDNLGKKFKGIETCKVNPSYKLNIHH